MSLTAPLVPAAQALAAGASEWIIPYASGPSADAWADLKLPHLQALLTQQPPRTVVQGDEFDFSPPHERLLARALQLPDAPGLIPWAALAAQDTTQACAFITPCNWHVGADHVLQSDPMAMPLSEDESRQLLALLAPWFKDDGITLEYLQPKLWLARGAAFENLATASIDRALNRDVRPWLPDAKQAAVIQRLQSEVQMLLYTHVFNDNRAALGQVPINAFWLHGSGQLSSLPAAPAKPVACISDLYAPALQGNVAGWRQALQQLDASVFAALQQRAAQGELVKLTLCGESNAVQWQSATPGILQKIKSLFASKSLPDMQSML